MLTKSRQAQDIAKVLINCSPIVCDDGPAQNQHWGDVRPVFPLGNCQPKKKNIQAANLQGTFKAPPGD